MSYIGLINQNEICLTTFSVDLLIPNVIGIHHVILKIKHVD